MGVFCGSEYRRHAHEIGAVAMMSSVLLLVPATPSFSQLSRAPYIQAVSENSVTVSWRTEDQENSRVQYGPAPNELSAEVVDGAQVNTHDVRINGLWPGTRYYYSVGSSSAVHAGNNVDHWFETSPVAGSAAPFTAWVMGDTGMGSANQAAIRDQGLAFMGGLPDLVIHAGDAAYSWGTEEAYSDNYFGMYPNILRNVVGWMVPANHDDYAGNDPVNQTGPFFEAFAPPTGGESGGVASGTELYYSFDYGNVHFVALDSYFSDASENSVMVQWLFEDLVAATQPWLVAFWHHPPYTKGTHDSDKFEDGGGRHQAMRENVVPLLEAAGVDMVFGGHSHTYERSFLVNGVHCPSCEDDEDLATPPYSSLSASGHILDSGDGDPSGSGAYLKSPGLNSNQGAVYVVAGHGGGDYLGMISLHPVMHFGEPIGGSVVLDFDGNSVTVANVRQSGVVSDSFTLVKRVVQCSVDSDCDDANICTDDSCSGGTSTCLYTPNIADCSDDDPCNGTEICDGSGGCGLSSTPPDCDDGNTCTNDSCGEGGGCENLAVADGSTCDDGDPLTANDQCLAGTCSGSGSNLCSGVTCTASDQCHTVGTCDPATGICSDPSATDGTACDDGQAGTSNDQCTDGDCAGTVQVQCGDVDADGTVDVVDALLVAQYTVGLRGCATIPTFDRCDVSPQGMSDSRCGIGDALRMAQCSVGLVSCEMVCGTVSCD